MGNERQSTEGDGLKEFPAVSMNDLWFSYDGFWVLQQVNLTVMPHEFVSIVGPNGGGKTTLIKLMLGLLQPTRGSARVLGKTPSEARPKIGYTPQHAHLDPQFPIKVWDVVLMARLGGSRGLLGYQDDDLHAVEQAMKKLQVLELAHKHFSSLSGGQRQRVLIARALACQPELLLLDEPTAGLDLSVETEFYDLLKHVTEDLTVCMVSHDLGFVSRLVSKVVCVKGRVVVHPTSEITGEIINEVYGAPMKMVRHDLNNSGAYAGCSNS